MFTPAAHSDRRIQQFGPAAAAQLSAIPTLFRSAPMNALKLALLSTVLLAAPAAALELASHDVTSDPRTRSTHFVVRFKGIPQFGPLNGFKFGISRDENVGFNVPGGSPDVAVWTGEIGATGGLVVR